MKNIHTICIITKRHTITFTRISLPDGTSPPNYCNNPTSPRTLPGNRHQIRNYRMGMMLTIPHLLRHSSLSHFSHTYGMVTLINNSCYLNFYFIARTRIIVNPVLAVFVVAFDYLRHCNHSLLCFTEMRPPIIANIDTKYTTHDGTGAKFVHR